MRWVIIIVTAVVLIGCGDSVSSTADAAGSLDVAADSNDGDVTRACPLVGVYQVAQISCGGNDITSEWTTVLGISTTLTITDTSLGCTYVLENVSSSCDEQEMGTLVALTAERWQDQRDGVVSCEPINCTFSTEDQPCVLGERAGTVLVTITQGSGQLVTVTDEPSGPCASLSLPSAVTWSRVQ